MLHFLFVAGDVITTEQRISMIITFILSLIGIFGTLTIVAYLNQMEEGMAELQEQLVAPICPVCLVHHSTADEKKLYTRFKHTTNYYNRKRKVLSRYCRLRKRK
ncbi:hypothetical protein [Pontibacter sp. H249]|uniref:hypothetical protein n=1 Tax=Pontibacter sp. H249 TaxID=3133420 RepID=UPI0030BC2413